MFEENDWTSSYPIVCVSNKIMPNSKLQIAAFVSEACIFVFFLVTNCIVNSWFDCKVKTRLANSPEIQRPPVE